MYVPFSLLLFGNGHTTTDLKRTFVISREGDNKFLISSHPNFWLPFSNFQPNPKMSKIYSIETWHPCAWSGHRFGHKWNQPRVTFLESGKLKHHIITSAVNSKFTMNFVSNLKLLKHYVPSSYPLRTSYMYPLFSPLPRGNGHFFSDPTLILHFLTVAPLLARPALCCLHPSLAGLAW